MTSADPWAEGFNVFGELDVDDVPDDPYHIDNGRYNFIVTKAEFKKYDLKDMEAVQTAANNGEPSWFMRGNYTVQIDEPNNQFHGKGVPLNFMLYPWLTKEKLNDMTDLERKQKMIESGSRHKEFWRGIGLSESDIRELNPNTVASIVVGLKFSAQYSENNTADGRKYRNLTNYKEVEETEQTGVGEFFNTPTSELAF